MDKTVLTIGIVLLIAGITLTSLAIIPLSSQWVTRTFYDFPKSEMILNKSFEVPQGNITSCQVHLEANDSLTMNAASLKPGTNRNSGAKIDFTFTDDTQTYQSYNRTANISISWIAPKSGNYSFNFDNSNGNSSKEVIVIAMRNWRETMHPIFLVNTPLIGPSFVLIGIVICAIGALVVTLALSRKRPDRVSNMGNPQQG